MGKKTWLILIAAAVLLTVMLSGAGGFWVMQALERRLEMNIEGNYRPELFSPSFKLLNARIDWKNRVRLEKGNLRVTYSIETLLKSGRLRIRIEGKELPIELLGDWAKIQGVNRVVLDSLTADLELDVSGLREIHEIHANSPKFQFHIQKSGV